MNGSINIRLACPECFGAGHDYWLLMPRSLMETGAPLCPIHECCLWTVEDFKLSADLKKQMRTMDKPINICQFIALKGGITATPDLRQILARHHMTVASCYIKGGKGRLIMASGQLTVSSAMEATIEAGYLSDAAYETDFLDAIDETLEGRPFYSSNDIGAAAEIDQLERQLA